MGNSIANSMAEKQKEMQKEMIKVQQQNMLKSQERMRRMQIAAAMAMARDQVMWMTGAGGIALTGLGAYTLRVKAFPKVAIVPITIYSYILAYQWDFAYGNKTERVNKMFNDIITTEQHWFVPIEDPPVSTEKLQEK